MDGGRDGAMAILEGKIDRTARRPWWRPRADGGSSLPMGKTPDLHQDVMDLGGDIVSSERFAMALAVPHHNPRRTVASHSLETAEYALRIARWLNRHGASVSEEDAVRASLMHDLGMTEDEVFLSPSRKKAFSHPRAGSRIAREEFRANDVQVDAVRRHMWPIGLTPPRNMEGWVVVAADKCCSVREAQRYARDAAGQLADTLLG